MIIYCCGCQDAVPARLTNGAEIYLHRADLAKLPFWRCPTCNGYVGCHHKTSAPTTPLGVIPTTDIREARKRIHASLDPLWMNGTWKRKDLYARLSAAIGRPYHTADLRSRDECDLILNELEKMK